MPMPRFPGDLDWRVYGFDPAVAGEPLLLGYGFDGHRPLYGDWRIANVTLHYGKLHDPDIPHYQVVSAPRLSATALQQLHSGLDRSGFAFGMSGTGHISGAPEPAERTTARLDDVPVEAEAWRGESAEVAWIETADTWIVVFASRYSLTDIRLKRISDVNPLIEARSAKFGLNGLGL
jgi:hypothetical protein